MTKSTNAARGKRISLAPLSFEAALEALIQVPPPMVEPEKPKPARKKKRAAKKARRKEK
jgi:hypothetical protein